MKVSKTAEDHTARYADMFAAMGTEARLRIIRLLLSAHPAGMIVGDIQAELGIPASALSHHLEKLRTKIWSGCGVRARISGTAPTRKL